MPADRGFTRASSGALLIAFAAFAAFAAFVCVGWPRPAFARDCTNDFPSECSQKGACKDFTTCECTFCSKSETCFKSSCIAPCDGAADCVNGCVSSADCDAGLVCGASGDCEAPIDPGPDPGCSCGLELSPEGAPAIAALLLAGAAIAARRRRQKA